MKRRIVVEVQGSRRDYVVSTDREFDGLLDQIRRGLVALSQKPHCVNVVVSVHLNGEACDHE